MAAGVGVCWPHSSSSPSTVETECPVCVNDEAYVETDAPRAPEGAETRTSVCTECDHEWEEFLD